MCESLFNKFIRYKSVKLTATGENCKKYFFTDFFTTKCIDKNIIFMKSCCILDLGIFRLGIFKVTFQTIFWTPDEIRKHKHSENSLSKFLFEYSNFVTYNNRVVKLKYTYR